MKKSNVVTMVSLWAILLAFGMYSVLPTILVISYPWKVEGILGGIWFTLCALVMLKIADLMGKVMKQW